MKQETSTQVTHGREENEDYSIESRHASKNEENHKRSKKVEEMLYNKFRGSQATRYGTLMEDTSRIEYQSYQNERGHTPRTIRTGLVISSENPWLAASPDDQVHDMESSLSWGLGRV